MIGAAVQQGLRDDGHAVDWVRDGREAETAAAGGSYDLVILDLGLPRRDGRGTGQLRCYVAREALTSAVGTPLGR